MWIPDNLLTWDHLQVTKWNRAIFTDSLTVFPFKSGITWLRLVFWLLKLVQEELEFLLEQRFTAVNIFDICFALPSALGTDEKTSSPFFSPARNSSLLLTFTYRGQRFLQILVTHCTGLITMTDVSPSEMHQLFTHAHFHLTWDTSSWAVVLICCWMI